MDKKREVFIKLDKEKSIVESLNFISSKQKILRSLFKEYDTLSIKEAKIFDNWGSDMEELQNRLYQLVL